MEQFIIATARQLHLPNMFNYMAPVLIVLVIAEWILSALEENDRYGKMDTLADFLLGVGNLIVIGSIKIGFISMVLLGYKITPVRLPSTWWSVTICFLLLDLTGYWAHRISHETRVFWAAHVTHHSSEKYNLAINFRNGWTSHITLMFYIPSMFMGLNPMVFLITYQLHQIYQFWIHTEYIGKLPRFFEFILVTPSHHRVHHASNEQYLDKNYGIALIIWDRLFGTFVEEVEKPRYGLTKPVNSYNPIYLNFHVWRDMITDVARSKNIKQTWKMIFARPSEVNRIKKDFEISASADNTVKERSNIVAPIVLSRKGVSINKTSCSSCANCRRSYGAAKLKSLAIAIFCALMVLSGRVRSQDEIRIHSIPTKGETVNVTCPKNEHTAVAKSFLCTLLPAGIGIIGIKLSGFSLHGDNDHVQTSTLVGSAGLLLYGLYIGPSAGDFYAHDYGSAYGGILARCFGTYMLIRYKKHSRESSGSMRALGCLLIGGSYLYNFLSCRGAVKRYNRIHFGKTNMAITPKLDIRNSNYGFAVDFRFN